MLLMGIGSTFVLFATIVYSLGYQCCMAYEAYVAIGPHKTGSSDVQAALCRYKEAIESQCNVKVALFTESCAKSGAKIAAYYQGKPNANQKQTIIQQWFDLIGDCDSNIFVASENFDRLDLDQIYSFKKALACYEKVTIVATHRAHLHHIESQWKQFEKFLQADDDDGLAYLGFNEYFVASLRLLKSSYALDPTNTKRLLDDWGKVFDEDKIIIVSFEGALEKLAPDPDAIFLAISNSLGMCNLDRVHVPPHIQNQSPSAMVIEALAEIRKFLTLRDGLSYDDIKKITLNWNSASRSKTEKMVELIKELPQITTTYVPTQDMIDIDEAIIRGDFGQVFFTPAVTNRSIYREPLVMERVCIECISKSPKAMKVWREILDIAGKILEMS